MTAHRPTFDPVWTFTRETDAVCSYLTGTGKRSTTRASISPAPAACAYTTQSSVCVLESLQQVHYLTVTRQPGQGGDADHEVRDLRAELLAAEATHFAKAKGVKEGQPSASDATPKRPLGIAPGADGPEDEDPEAKRRRILQETRDIDADSDGADKDSSDEDR